MNCEKREENLCKNAIENLALTINSSAITFKSMITWRLLQKKLGIKYSLISVHHKTLSKIEFLLHRQTDDDNKNNST